MYVYEVGKRYHPDCPSWAEGTQYNYRAGAHELLMCFAKITPKEVAAITRRPCEFGALAIPPTIFFLYKFQTIDWSDAPYSIHLVKAERPQEATAPPILEEQERALLNIVLVEATTGIIAGMRVVSLSINLSRYLHTAISDQLAAAFDPAAYDQTLQDIYCTTPTTNLVRRAERMIVR